MLVWFGSSYLNLTTKSVRQVAKMEKAITDIMTCFWVVGVVSKVLREKVADMFHGDIIAFLFLFLHSNVVFSIDSRRQDKTYLCPPATLHNGHPPTVLIHGGDIVAKTREQAGHGEQPEDQTQGLRDSLLEGRWGRAQMEGY